MTSPSVKLLRTQTDDRLVALAAAGHERAFEAIVERYRRPLLRHCRRFLPEARAEDALQQALVSAWSALRRGDDVRELRPWLYRIVHNTSLNALRAAGYDYEQLHDALQAGGGPAELAERGAVVRQTLAGLAALPERQREALLRIAVEGRSQDEVADELGLSHGAVRQLVHRARTSLRTAATAMMPLPLAGWLASGGHARGDLVERVGELVAGAGGGVTLAKAGAVAAIAGSAVGGPVLVDRVADRQGEQARSAALVAPARADGDGTAERGRGDAQVTPAAARDGERHGDDSAAMDRSGRRGGDEGEDRSGPRGGDDEPDRSGRRGGDDEVEHEESSGSGSSGSGEVEQEESSGSGSSGSGEVEHEESSGSGSREEERERDESSGSGAGRLEEPAESD
jgi:RNA polymerase sigma factor (sigma-70 family)